MTAAIGSTFDADTEGWTIQGDVQSFTWQSSGGDPGGHLAWVDAATGADCYWLAPAAYLGDKSAYYGGSFSYEIEDTGNSYSGVPDLELTGGGLTLVRAVGQPAAASGWTPYSVNLTETGWHVGTLAGAATTAGQMQQVLGGLTTLAIRAEFVNGDESGGLDDVTMTACYAAGTMILTERGEVAVEALLPGDLVRTAGGAIRPVKWLGHRRVDCARHPRPAEVMPIRVAVHAFAEGRPHRDLVLSPDHAVFIAGGVSDAPGDADRGAPGVLIPIRHLQNGATIRPVTVAHVTYHHVELDTHDLLLAEGLAAESYLDTGNRAAFANARDATMLHADFARAVWATQGCARLVVTGPERDAEHSRLLHRATLLGHVITADAQLHVIVDGQRLAPQILGKTYRFHLPPSTRSARLVSRHAAPMHVSAESDDARCLGVAVSRILADGQPMAWDDARLGAGWHAAEPAWRWTDGSAELAPAGIRVLDIDVAMTARYWTEPTPAQAAAGLRLQTIPPAAIAL